MASRIRIRVKISHYIQPSNLSSALYSILCLNFLTLNQKTQFSWAEVEDEKTKVNTEDETAVFASAKKLYEASLRYLDKMRQIEAQQVEKLR